MLSAVFGEYIITLKWGKSFGLALVWCCFLGDRMCQLIFINLTQTLVYLGRGTSREKATPPDGLQVNLQGIFLIHDLCGHPHSSTHTHCRHTSLCMIIMKINLFNNSLLKNLLKVEIQYLYCTSMIYLFLYSVYELLWQHADKHVEVRTTCRSPFSPATSWVPESI